MFSHYVFSDLLKTRNFRMGEFVFIFSPVSKSPKFLFAEKNLVMNPKKDVVYTGIKCCNSIKTFKGNPSTLIDCFRFIALMVILAALSALMVSPGAHDRIAKILKFFYYFAEKKHLHRSPYA